MAEVERRQKGSCSEAGLVKKITSVFSADSKTVRGFPCPSPRCTPVSTRQLSSLDVFKLLK